MRDNPSFAVDDAEAVKQLIRDNSWATFISHVPEHGLVASHYPVLLEEDAEAIVLLSHVGRPDEEKHQLGQHPMLVVIQGPHGYISPGWYQEQPSVPTWNFAVAHLHGRPEILGDQQNLEVLDALVEHFEQHLDNPQLLHATEASAELAARLAAGTVGFRMRVNRFEAKEKMSQNKPAATIERIIAELRGSGPYAHPGLADRMESINAEALNLGQKGV
ncbi:FMN-binding negative transcriptional regulator [Nesterenkonia sp.]|uniref:FMN-binding negative transcriptional regulator n=1 Tax=Nesterenkonia sp. TaxID=704201 RepID=UPI00261E581C|nr:FMN-binding negative transcriptional regulator [Nesterenkonia sp.]